MRRAIGTEALLRSRRPCLQLASALLLLWTLGGTARAGDPVEEARVAEARTLLEHLAAGTAAADKEKLERALAKVVKVHNELQTKRVREDLQEALGAVVAEESCGALRLVAADTLGRLNDPDGAYGQLRKHLPSVKEAAAGPLPLRVIQAVGALAPDRALSALGKLLEKAKDPNVSRHAAQALGRYGWSRHRAKVLTTLVEYLRRLRPGGTNLTKGRAGGAAARERYDLVAPTLVAALVELTGRKELDGVDKWLEAWQEHRKRPAELFTFER